MALKTMYGIESGIDFSKLYGLSKLVRELAGVPVPPNRGIVGDRIFHVESGIIATLGQERWGRAPDRGLSVSARRWLGKPVRRSFWARAAASTR